MSVLLDVIDRSTRLGDKTKEAYKRCVGRFVAFAGDNPSAWNGATVEAWRDSLLVSLGPSTVNKHLYALRYASRRIEGLGMGADFARAAESVPARQFKERKALSVDQVRALMETCQHGRPFDLRDRAIMVIALRTGLRSSNIVGLSWGNIQGRVAKCIVKGGKPHTVILDDQCLAALEDWKQCLEQHNVGTKKGGVFRAIREQLDGTWSIGKPLRSRKAINQILERRARKAGVGPVHPHLFRHTFVSWALEAGVAPHRVMRQTGHANMATLSRYVTDLEAEANPIGDHLPEF